MTWAKTQNSRARDSVEQMAELGRGSLLLAHPENRKVEPACGTALPGGIHSPVLLVKAGSIT